MYKVLFFFIAFKSITLAQNLVPNPSFETVSNCPSFYDQSYLANGWCSSGMDLYSTCALLSSNVNVPINKTPTGIINYQMPHSGSNYVGGDIYMNSYVGEYFREVITTRLISKLEFGKQYCITFYTNPWNNNWVNGAMDRIGIYLTADTAQGICIYGLQQTYTPAIESPTGVLINDTLNWTKVSGLYTGLGIEKFLTLGCLRPDSIITVMPAFIEDSVWAHTYYLFDDISIIEVLNKIEAGRDTVTCINDSVQIGLPPIDGVEYHWQPHTGLSNPYISNPKTKISQNTTYTLTTLQCNVTLHDTLTVSVTQPPCPVSVKELNATVKGLRLLPNPSNGSVRTNISVADDVTLNILNSLGEIVFSKHNLNTEIELNLNKGIYFYNFSSKSSYSKYEKLILE